MKHTGSRLRTRITIVGMASFVLVWAAVAYEIDRNKSNEIHDAELRTVAESQIFAEYSESTIKRLNELILDLRGYWTGDWHKFAELIQHRQENITDIAFQVSVIDRDGILAFSNLAKPEDRTDLSGREHFRVHKEAEGVDRLFISKPVKGKVSGKWSIQVTRPIFKNGQFDGVLVVSVSPELFSTFATNLQIAGGSVIALVKDSGEVMARYPVLESSYDQVLKDRPYLSPGAPISGNDRRIAVLDGVERLYGYHKLPAQGLNFVIGEPLDEILAPYYTYRNYVVGAGIFVSVFAAFLFFGLIRSLSALDEVRRQLEVSKERADAANVAKSQFLATMSHEIRTPMNGILGMAQLLMLPDLGGEERHEYTRIILASGQTLLTLLNDILDLSKVEAGRIELEHITTSPERIIQEVATLFAGQAESKGVRIETAWHGPLGSHYRSDPIRLRQMLSNLTSNAVKFTAQGIVRIEGRVESISDSEVRLEFSVTDTGMGVPEEKLEMLFKPFSQVDASTTRKYGGTGLGLSIVRSLAQLMGGDVGVVSRSGEGSRFYFQVRGDVVEAPAEIADFSVREALTPVVPASSPGHVLVVDDNPTNRRVIEVLLKKLGMGCESAENGEEAVAAITSGNIPKIILMDCQMPVMDGFEATKAIRHWESAYRQGRTPIVALTADAFPEDRARCMDAGMDDFLSKPIDFKKLAAMIAKWSDSGEGVDASPTPGG